jgi:uncharacterized protein
MLLALLDAAHVHHLRAKDWLLSQPDPAWSSCPLTQNGFIRIISQPAYPGHLTVTRATELLAQAAATEHHHFWYDDVSFLDESVFNRSRIHGPKQITDAYLLALAVKNDGRFVALDRSIPIAGVRKAKEERLVVL